MFLAICCPLGIETSSKQMGTDLPPSSGLMRTSTQSVQLLKVGFGMFTDYISNLTHLAGLKVHNLIKEFERSGDRIIPESAMDDNQHDNQSITTY